MNRQKVPNANRNEPVQENMVLIQKARDEGSGESAQYAQPRQSLY